MELGAVVLIPEASERGSEFVSAVRPPYWSDARAQKALPQYPLWPVVGKNLLQDWTERIERAGVEVVSVQKDSLTKYFDIASFLQLARQGLERFLFICLRDYAEIDLLELVRFHYETRNPVTEVIDQEGPLGVRIIDRTLLPNSELATARNEFAEYRFGGYVKRMMSVRSYRDLVSDALSGRCALRPLGSQIDDAIWIAEDARIASSVRFIGPCYVGAGTVLRECVSVGPYSSIENNCEIDCGTAIENSSILPQTFLSAGLSVRRAVVDAPLLEQLDSGTIVNLQAAGLGRRLRSKGEAQSNRYPRRPLAERQITYMRPPCVEPRHDIAAAVGLNWA